jgi:hypothetical protein
MFTGLQMVLSKAGNGLSLGFTVLQMQVSPQAQQAQPCSLPALISDAHAQALKIANAANMALGQVLALANALSGTNVTCSATVKFAMGAAI